MAILAAPKSGLRRLLQTPVMVLNLSLEQLMGPTLQMMGPEPA